MKSRSLAPKTPRRAEISSFTNQSLRLCVTVVIEHDKICSTRRATRLRYFVAAVQLDRCVSNLRQLPLTIWIATTQVRHLQQTIASRLDLIE
jgi:hypothetical protein